MLKQQSLVKYKAKQKCPVVAVTAFCDDSVKENAEKVGIAEVINKPVSQEQLIDVLLRHGEIH
jgi:FixJ family two-component response regulator